jgi:hypothetical protein
MSVSLAAQLCRVVAPEQLPDRHLVSGVLAASDARMLGEQVILSYLFEVTHPWLPSSQLLPSLIATLTQEYATLSAAGPAGLDDRLEELLKAVNQQLNAVSEAGETDWIGNLNGIIMIFSGEEVHFSQTGRCPAYLLQANRIRQITDDPAEQPADAHPLKTFSNLASGQLKAGDVFLVANHDLYREISLDALRRIMNTATPYQASLAIAKELKQEKNQSVSGLIVKISETAPATAEPEAVLLEEEHQSWLRKFGRKVKPIAEQAKVAGMAAATATVAATKQASEVVKEKVGPQAAALVEKGKQALASKDEAEAPTPSEAPAVEAAPEPDAAAPTPVPEESPIVERILPEKERAPHLAAIAAAAEARLEEQETEDDFSSIIPPEERFLEDHSAPIPRTGMTAAAHQAGKKVSGLLTRSMPAVRLALARLSKWLSLPGNRKKAALGTGLILIILTVTIGVRAAHRPKTATNTLGNAAILQQLESLKIKLADAASANDADTAAPFAAEATQKLGELKNPSSAQQQQADALWSAIQKSVDTLTATTRFATSTTSYTLTGEARGFVTGLPYFYGWSPTGSAVLRTGRGEAEQTQESIPLANPSDPLIAMAKSSESDTVGYALSKQGLVFRLTQIGVDTFVKEVAPVEGEFAVGDAITTYANNVYILDGKAGLLWKYANTGTQYNKGVSMIDINKYDLKKGVSVSIDGSVYVLKSTGELLKFSSGKQEASFALNNLPAIGAELVQPVQVVTSDTMNSIYVLDAGATSSAWSSARVLEFNKSGGFIAQYAFPKELTKVRAFDINPKDKKLWVLNEHDIFEFDL